MIWKATLPDVGYCVIVCPVLHIFPLETRPADKVLATSVVGPVLNIFPLETRSADKVLATSVGASGRRARALAPEAAAAAQDSVVSRFSLALRRTLLLGKDSPREPLH